MSSVPVQSFLRATLISSLPFVVSPSNHERNFLAQRRLGLARPLAASLLDPFVASFHIPFVVSFHIPFVVSLSNHERKHHTTIISFEVRTTSEPLQHRPRLSQQIETVVHQSCAT
ncbi:hypothetical protein [Dokdonella sp.]|nr:hypothetical protein [Dokdonella sp.]